MYRLEFGHLEMKFSDALVCHPVGNLYGTWTEAVALFSALE